MKSNAIQCLSSTGFHRLHFTEWGDRDNPKVLLCVHGLTRCARDFDTIAAALEADYRVICPDIAGRGESEWLKNSADYTYQTYLADMTALIAYAQGAGALRTLHWLGTSMGGILGMLMAAQPGSPIQKLVINDVGAMIPKSSLERIGKYVGTMQVFKTYGAIVDAVRAVSPFGPLSQDQWRDLTLPLVRQTDDGMWQFRYDTAIADTFAEFAQADVDLWPNWNAITAPTMVIRGAQSDLLLPSTFAEMCAKPGVVGLEIANTGHAPMLQDAPTIAAVREFLVGEA